MARDRGRPTKSTRRRRPSGPRDHAQASGLLALAETKLQHGELVDAERAASKALACTPENPLTATNLLATICVELGDIDRARGLFLQAVELDPRGEVPEPAGGGAEKFLWLAQLTETGGRDSLQWYERAMTILRASVAQKGDKLAQALCGMAEIYMTDLSWEDDAEEHCERLITEALLAAPSSAETLQTLASIRISQMRMDDARKALLSSLDLWTHLDPEAAEVPAFPTRISLTRLLMEAGLEDRALEVLERLISEDDQSVETWYLGGWCLYLLSQEQSNLQHASREWLNQALRLFQLTDYEDERLRQHCEELVVHLNQSLGDAAMEESGDSGWESQTSSDADPTV